MSNLSLEGGFSTYHGHGDVQLDPIRQEFLLQLLNWDIEPERKERRQPEFLQKDNEAKKKGLPLAHADKNAKQLAHGARMHSACSAMFTTAELNGAYERSKKRREERNTAERREILI